MPAKKRRKNDDPGKAVTALESLCEDLSALTSLPYLSEESSASQLLHVVRNRDDVNHAPTTILGTGCCSGTLQLIVCRSVNHSPRDRRPLPTNTYSARVSFEKNRLFRSLRAFSVTICAAGHDNVEKRISVPAVLS